MYQVGQKLWFVPTMNRHSKPSEVTITKVGRKWLTLDNHMRADINDLIVDGGEYPSPAVCYLSKEQWALENSLYEEWRNFCRNVDANIRAPSGLTIQNIQDARKILGI